MDFLKPEQNITIITNGLKALSTASSMHIKAYGTGGKLIDNSLAMAGSIALKTILSMHADYMFFSSQGISDDGIITDQSEQKNRAPQCYICGAEKKFFI